MSYFDKEHQKSYNDLPEDERDKIKGILFITDKFCIGTAAYHEMTMSPGGEELPRTYLIRQCKENMNELCHITRTPGYAHGAQIVFEEDFKTRIKSEVNNDNSAKLRPID